MPNPFEAELNQLVNRAVAKGLNRAGEIALSDIKRHVQFKTGRLSNSYTITQRATPDRLDVQIDSPLSYKSRHYPAIPTWIPRERNRAMQGNPLWGTDPNDTTKYDAMVRGEVEAEIQREL
jgi:hypothetical protein